MTDTYKMVPYPQRNAAMKPADDVRFVPENVLEVGHDYATHEVVVNHPNIQPDDRGAGFIVFSVAQARAFAHALLRQARLAELEAGGMKPEAAEMLVRQTDR